uniref:Uncharacterized protein n=1 Tax=Catagonus wagneri TaxID=51154 RepID=A0A8C3VII3_9CETA
MLKRQYFEMYNVNGQEKHSTVGTSVLASVFWSVFSFNSLYSSIQNSGSGFDKEVCSHTMHQGIISSILDGQSKSQQFLTV